MRISRLIKRRKLFLVFWAVLLLFAISGYIFSGYLASFIFDRFKLLEGSKLSAKRCFYSFSDGIVFKGFKASFLKESIIIPRLSVKKENGLFSLIIDGAVLDAKLFGGFMASYGVAGSNEAIILKVYLSDVKIKIQDSYLNVKEGFIYSDELGVHWDLELSHNLAGLKSRGFISSIQNRCNYTADIDFIDLSIVGEYDFKDNFLRAELSFGEEAPFLKSKIYAVESSVGWKENRLFLKDVLFGPVSAAGPVFFDFKENIKFDWVIQAGGYNANGLLDLSRAQDKVNLYLKILKFNINGSELITNCYLEYVLSDSVLKFHSIGTVVNKMPFPEIDFKLKFSDNEVILEEFNYQGGISLNGSWNYGFDYSISGKFNNFDLQHLVSLIVPLYARYLSISRVDGSFTVFSYQGESLTDIVLDISGGRIIDISFQKGNLRLIGNSSFLEFVNSELSIDGEKMAFEGSLNLAEFPNPEMWKNVYLVPVSSSYPWSTISFEDRFGSKKMSLGTKLKENVKLDYNVEFSVDENYNRNEVSLEIMGKPNLKLRLKEGEEIMGLEKSIKF
ncbi:MAG: hypothetical protein PHQ54_01685 [Candidatus Omnitrophica bacterium]|nr:hypothetical protein [Candidatus Omnitrophota bacterium]